MRISLIKLYSCNIKKVSLLCIAIPTICFSQLIWEWRHPLPTGYQLNSATFGNNHYVIVGERGTILYSQDGGKWTHCFLEDTLIIHSVAYGNGLFVAVGGSSILNSSDGSNWTINKSITGKYLTSVQYAHGLFVAAGDKGALFLSNDGKSWTDRSLESSRTIRAVAYGADIFLAVGDSFVATSSDGVSWSHYSKDHLFAALAYGNGKFLSGTSNRRTLSSIDGLTWSDLSSEIPDAIIDMAFGNNNFMAVDYSGKILTTPDGVQWTKHDIGSYSYKFTGLSFINNHFVVVGRSGAILFSEDGKNFTRMSSDLNISLRSMIVHDSVYVAIGAPLNSVHDYTILHSINSTNWQLARSGFYVPLNSAAYGNNRFVAVGESGSLITSVDGTTWEKGSSPHKRSFGCIIFANKQFIAVGDSGGIITSQDGLSWKAVASGTNKKLYSLTFGNNHFLAVGSSGTILSSSDGNVWEKLSSDTTVHFRSVISGKGQFLVMSDNKIFLSSDDGITWDSLPLKVSTSSYFNSVFYGDSQFVASTASGVIFFSNDGKNWTSEKIDFDGFKCVTCFNGHFYLLGQYGMIVSSKKSTMNVLPSKIEKSVPEITDITITNKYVMFKPNIFSENGYITVRLYAVTGRLIFSETVNRYHNYFKFSISKLAAGSYMLSLFNQFGFKSKLVMTRL